METLKQFGYIIQIEILPPHNYGIPQQRERVYIICARCDLYIGKHIPLLYDATTITNLEDFIDQPSAIEKKHVMW